MTKPAFTFATLFLTLFAAAAEVEAGGRLRERLQTRRDVRTTQRVDRAAQRAEQAALSQLNFVPQENYAFQRRQQYGASALSNAISNGAFSNSDYQPRPRMQPAITVSGNSSYNRRLEELRRDFNNNNYFGSPAPDSAFHGGLPVLDLGF